MKNIIKFLSQKNSNSLKSLSCLQKALKNSEIELHPLFHVQSEIKISLLLKIIALELRRRGTIVEIHSIKDTVAQKIRTTIIQSISQRNCT